jgi:hypothetical protein
MTAETIAKALGGHETGGSWMGRCAAHDDHEPNQSIRDAAVDKVLMVGEGVETCFAAINAAEEIGDPVDGLVEKTTADPGAPFAPDALERLAIVKNDDRALIQADSER